MSDASTTKMISMYMERASAPMYLSGFFRSPRENFHTSEEIEFDIEREDEEVAVVVADLSLGSRKNEATVLTNKKFKPPIFSESGPINSFDLIKRAPGQNPFQDPNYGANATRQAFGIFRKLENKIRRAIELMSSEVLQLGTVTLINEDGVALYTIDFQQKATHRRLAAVTWSLDGLTGDPLEDLKQLAIIIRRDGKREPKRMIFGDSAWTRFLANLKVQAALNLRRGELIQVAPVARGEGATFQGWVWLGHYRMEMWTYDGFYKHQQSGVATPYVATDNVIMLGDGRLDLTYGAIPQLVPPDRRVLSFLPPRIASSSRGIDLTTNAWVNDEGTSVSVSAGTRPLTIPTAIDTFGVQKALAA